jgi:hypothetical protein
MNRDAEATCGGASARSRADQGDSVVRNIAVTMAAAAALGGTVFNAVPASAMPFNKLAAPSSVIAVQAADYICGPSYGCWMQPNPFYGPFYGP